MGVKKPIAYLNQYENLRFRNDLLLYQTSPINLREGASSISRRKILNFTYAVNPPHNLLLLLIRPACPLILRPTSHK